MEFSHFAEAVLKLVFASFFVERSLSLFFESKWFISLTRSSPNFRPNIAFVYSMFFVYATGPDSELIFVKSGLARDFLFRVLFMRP